MVKTWLMVAPLASIAPDTLDETTVQLKVVPATVPAKAMEGAFPEQMVFDAGVAVTVGMGLTVITTVMAVPGHPLADGVIV